MGVYAGARISQQIYESLLLALCVSVLVSVIVGLLVEVICFKAVRSDNPLTSMVSAFAMWMVLEELIILLTWGRLFPGENPTGLTTFDIGGFMVRGDYFILFGSLVALILIFRPRGILDEKTVHRISASVRGCFGGGTRPRTDGSDELV